jgi:hypothetical protein
MEDERELADRKMILSEEYLTYLIFMIYIQTVKSAKSGGRK